MFGAMIANEVARGRMKSERGVGKVWAVSQSFGVDWSIFPSLGLEKGKVMRGVEFQGGKMGISYG